MKDITSVLLVLIGVTFAHFSVGQNCTVNANINLEICANESLILNGSADGSFSQTAVWSQVGGPSVTITDPNSLVTSVTGYLPYNAYTFRLSAKCTDGSSIHREVTYTVQPITIANAGDDVSGCPGSFAVTANNPETGESGEWNIIGSNNAGVIIDNPNSPTSDITLPTDEAGTSTLRWTITNSNSCISYDEILVSNSGGELPVNAGLDQNLGTCYTTTHSTYLSASEGGSIPSQQGTWSLVSGPNYPIFANVHNNETHISGLIEGVYTLQWTVEGDCANGSDQMTITVDAATQGVTNASTSDVNYCNGFTQALLEGTVPQYSNESVEWIQLSGPTLATFSNPNSPTTAVIGLDGEGNYSFRYTITGYNGCSSSDVSYLRYYESPSIDAGPNQILACGENSVTLPFIFSGGSSTVYKIVNGPVTTDNISVNSNPLIINNLNTPGTYTIRLTRRTTGITCSNASDDVQVTISEGPTASDAGSPQILACAVNETNLAGNEPISGVGFWSQVSGPNTALVDDKYDKNTHISSLIAGDYVFKWTISNGMLCPVEESTTSVRVSLPGPTASAAGSDAVACASSIFTLSGNEVASGETGEWTVSPDAGIIISDPNDNEAEVDGLTPNTVYTFTWTISNACEFSESDMILTTGGATGPSTADAGDDICLPTGSTSVSLGATTPSIGIGTWGLVSGPSTVNFDDENSPVTNVSNLNEGTYVLEWTVDLLGCQSNSDQIIITVSGVPSVADAGADSLFVCGTSTNLAGNDASPSIGVWSLKSGPASASIVNPLDPNTEVSFVDQGTYTFTWSIDSEACQSGENSDDVVVFVSLPGTISNAAFSTSSTINRCGFDNVTLGANSPGLIEQGLWSVVGSSPNIPIISDPEDPNTTVTGLITGSYVFRWTITSGPFCTESFSDVEVNVSTTIDAGDDQNLCNQTQTILAANAGSSGVWTQVLGVSGPSITEISPYSVQVSNLDPEETYTFRYTTDPIYGCSGDFDDVQIIGYALPTTPAAGNDIELCTADGSFVTMSANTPLTGTGFWTQVSGPNIASFDDDSDPSAEVSSLQSGIYVFQWNITNGGCTTYFDVVRVIVYDPPTVAIAGADQPTSCQLNATLVGNTPATGIGTWTLESTLSGSANAVIDFPNQPETTISGITNPTDTYVFRWTISNGTCADSFDEVSLTFTGDVPSTPDAGPDQELCDVNSTSMAANDPAIGVGTWSLISGPGSPIIDNSNSHVTPISNLSPGTSIFMWSISSGGCTLEEEVSITVYEEPSNANAGPDQEVCPFEGVILNALAISVGQGEWSMIVGPSVVNFVDANSPTTIVNGIVSGSYTFRWSVSNGTCVAKFDEVQVEVKENCPPEITNDSYTTLEDSTLNVSTIEGILANDSDPEGHGISIASILVVEPLHGVVTVQPDGAFIYTPQPDYYGLDTLIVSVCDSAAVPLCSNNEVYITITPVNDEPSFVKGADQVVLENSPLQTVLNWASSIDAGAANESIQAFTFTVENDNSILFSSQPAISSTGTLTYTPAADTFGIAHLDVILQDNGGTANDGDDTSDTLSFTIKINSPPFADDHINPSVSSSDASANLDALEAVDPDGSIQSYTIVSLPSKGDLELGGVAITAGQIITPLEATQLVYVLDGDVNGEDTFTFTATDDDNASDLTPATVTIPISNTPPVAKDHLNSGISSSAEATFLDSDVLDATDIDGVIDSYTILTLPLMGVLTLDGSDILVNQILTPVEVSQLMYNPDGDENGNDTFTFTATDNDLEQDPTPATVTIPVLNTPPVADDNSNSEVLTTAGATTLVALTATDIDGIIVSYTVLTLPVGGVLELNRVAVVENQQLTPIEASNLTYDPSGSFSGDDSFTFTATDSNGEDDSSPATATIPVNDPPVANNDLVSTDEDNPVTIEILANDTDDFGIVSNTVDVDPTKPGQQTDLDTPEGFWEVADGGEVIFTPAEDFNGTAQITYLMQDGSEVESNIANITVTILPVNDPPIGEDQELSTIVGQSVGGDALEEAYDIDNTTLTVSSEPVNGPLNGTIVIHEDGTYTYTPDPGYAGTDEIELQICDSGDPLPSLCTTILVVIEIEVVSGEEVIIPEGFSPNGDGVNDFFVIQNHTGERLSFQVFNRWGNLVYKNDNYQNEWSGQANVGVTIGNGLPDGTYYYIVESESHKEVRFITIHR